MNIFYITMIRQIHQTLQYRMIQYHHQRLFNLSHSLSLQSYTLKNEANN